MPGTSIGTKKREVVTRELQTTVSDLDWKALEQELEAGYLANANMARGMNEEWSVADARLDPGA